MKQIPPDFLKKSSQEVAVRGSYFLIKDIAIRQLAQGAVKVPLGEVRRAAPPGLFVESDKGDHQLISLPLKDILRRIRPEHYERRADQHRVEVPESVGDLFGPRGQALSAVRILRKEDLRKSQAGTPETSTSAFPPKSSALPQRESPAAPAPPETPALPAPPRPGMQAGGTIAVPDALKMAMQSNAMAAPKTAAAPLPTLPPRPSVPAAPKKAAAPSSAPSPPRLSRSPDKKAPQAPEAPHAAAPAQPGVVPAAPSPGAGAQCISVPVAEISAQWPGPIRQEITYLHLDAAQCYLPIAEMMAAAKQGRIVFPWRSIRAWIQPSPPPGFGSKQDEVPLEIPLQAVVPSFLQGRSAPESRAVKTPPASVPEVLSARPTIPPAPQIPPAPSGATDFQLRTSMAAKSAGASAAAESRHFAIPLQDVSVGWPSQVVQEIQRLGLQQATLEIPLDILEADLKSGRIEHCWIQICSWIDGFPNDADTSHHASIRLELPLSVIAPRFFKSRQTAGSKKSYVPTDIPDLFNSNAPPPPPPPEVEAEPAPSPPPQAEAEVPAPAAPEKPAKRKLPANIAELFGEPKKRNWTPNEIVQKTAQIEGVAGALIALQDGLLVAACLPPEWKSETVAAFLPQMFGRMKQYARELNVGELHSIAFAVDKGHLEVFNAGLIYFSVLGFPDQPLPLAELTIIANELSRHTK